MVACCGDWWSSLCYAAAAAADSDGLDVFEASVADAGCCWRMMMRRRMSDAGIVVGVAAGAEWVVYGDVVVAGELDGIGFDDVVVDGVVADVDVAHMDLDHRQSSYHHPFQSSECWARWIVCCWRSI